MTFTATSQRAVTAIAGTVSAALIAASTSTGAYATGEADLPPVPEVSPTAIDTTDRQAVVDTFRNRWIPAYGTPTTQVGDPDSCSAGQPPAAMMTGALNAVNYARDLVGVPQVAFTHAKNQLAQQAALIAAANGAPTTRPPSTAKCWTAAGAEGAGKSALFAGLFMGGVPSIRNWLRLGGRSSMLHPGIPSMGWGTVITTTSVSFNDPEPPKASSAALHVIDAGTNSNTGHRVAWPPAGFFPEELTSAREPWSYFANDGYYTDMDAATVSMTRLSPGGPVNVPVQTTAVANELYFAPQGIVAATDAGSDVTYQVRIQGLLDDAGAPLPDVVYDVTLISARAPGTGYDGLPEDSSTDEGEEPTNTAGELSASGRVKFKGLAKGKAKVGRRVTVVLPKFNHKVTTKVRWYRSGRLVKTARGLKYKPKRADAGKRLQVKVTATWKGQSIKLATTKAKVVR